MPKRMVARNTAIESLEPLVLMSATTIEGSNVSEWISGDDNDNTIFAFGGDDSIYAPIGVNTVDGGSGVDALVVYEGVQADYSIQTQSDGSVVLRGPGLNGATVETTLRNVERILFNGGEYSVTNSQMQSPLSSPQADFNDSTTADVPFVADPTNAGPSSGDGTVFGTTAADWLSVDNASNVVQAGAGDDSIHAPLGNNTIDGGSGFDTLVVYEGQSSDFNIDHRPNGDVVVTGSGINGLQVQNTLRSVEQILFNDRLVDLGAAAAPNDSFQQEFTEPVPDVFVPQEPFTPVNETPAESVGFAPEPVESFVPPALSVSQSDQFMDDVIRLTNEIRSQFGLSQLTVNFELEAAAQTHADNLAFQDFFAHTGLDGLQPWDRAVAAGYDYQTIGENIAAGQVTPAEVVQAWFDSPGHRENLLNPAFTEIGVGFQYLENDTGNSNFNYYWTQLLGTERG